MAQYERRITIAAPIEEVFGFHLDTANLPRITPPYLHAQILEVQPSLGGGEIGKRVVMQLRPYSLVRQTLEVEFIECDPPYLLRDEQRRGPFRVWLQTRRFSRVEGGTELHDRVDYQLPFGWLGRLIVTLFVAGQVEAMFQWRQERLRDILEGATSE